MRKQKRSNSRRRLAFPKQIRWSKIEPLLELIEKKDLGMSKKGRENTRECISKILSQQDLTKDEKELSIFFLALKASADSMKEAIEVDEDEEE